MPYLFVFSCRYQDFIRSPALESLILNIYLGKLWCYVDILENLFNYKI